MHDLTEGTVKERVDGLCDMALNMLYHEAVGAEFETGVVRDPAGTQCKSQLKTAGLVNLDGTIPNVVHGVVTTDPSVLRRLGLQPRR